MNSVLANQANYLREHRNRVAEELRQVGISRWGINRLDARYLPTIIRPSEHVLGIAYGLSEGNSVMLVSTDHRVIFLNKKPMYVNQDDIDYDSISGVSFAHAGFGSTITLHTKFRDFKLRTFNRKASEQFIRSVEQRTM